jgi:hypothetical protein
VSCGVRFEAGDDDAGHERAEKALQTDALRQNPKSDQKRHRRPNADFGGAVLQPEEHTTKSYRPAGYEYGDRDGRDDGCQRKGLAPRWRKAHGPSPDCLEPVWGNTLREKEITLREEAVRLSRSALRLFHRM